MHSKKARTDITIMHNCRKRMKTRMHKCECACVRACVGRAQGCQGPTHCCHHTHCFFFSICSCLPIPRIHICLQTVLDNILADEIPVIILYSRKVCWLISCTHYSRECPCRELNYRERMTIIDLPSVEEGREMEKIVMTTTFNYLESVL